MKKFLLTLMSAIVLVAASPLSSYAESGWSYGTAHFTGRQPSNSRSVGGVLIYYTGNLKSVGTSGNTEYYECSGDACVIFPKNYTGRKIVVKCAGKLQVQYLK